MSKTLALIAGSGALVPEVIAAAERQGYGVRLLTLGRRRRILGRESVAFIPSAPETAIKAIREFGATALAMAGGVSLSDIARESIRRFFAGDSGQSLGDGDISGFAQQLSEMTGAALVGVHELAPELLAPVGHIGGPVPTEIQSTTAAFALSLARRAGAMDLGQAVVVAGQRAVATEDIAGTDALLGRVGRFTRLGLAADGESPLVLAKCAKPGQPLFVDLPAIGPVTVIRARKAGVRVIVVEAGMTILIQRQQLAAVANAKGVTVLGRRIGDD